MQKKKLSLKSLVVKSFVTQIDPQMMKGAKGGKPEVPEIPTLPQNCSAYDACLTVRNCFTLAGRTC